jgi:hypothetical protein
MIQFVSDLRQVGDFLQVPKRVPDSPEIFRLQDVFSFTSKI